MRKVSVLLLVGLVLVTSLALSASVAAQQGMHLDVIDCVLRKYAWCMGLSRGYSAHSMCATFITTSLDNGASLEDVQLAAGYTDSSTMKLYDRRGYNP